MTEFLLDPKNGRLVTLPIKYPKIWEMYKKAQSAFWVAEHFKFYNDIPDWENKLTDNERYFIKMILSFFAASDGIVNMNLVERFMNEITILEAKYFYGFQYMMENIHAETYALMIDTYIRNKNEKNEYLDAVQKMPCIKKKADWAFKWIHDHNSQFAHRLLAFAAVEGIFFSGAFCAIYWLKERNLMKSLTESNEAISRDEALHVEFACLLFNMLAEHPSTTVVHNIISEAVEIEKIFITDSLPCRLIGMNADTMKQYIEFIADRLLSMINYPKLWNVSNPFPFMDKISVRSQDNFFEKTVTDYSKMMDNERRELQTDF